MSETCDLLDISHGHQAKLICPLTGAANPCHASRLAGSFGPQPHAQWSVEDWPDERRELVKAV